MANKTEIKKFLEIKKEESIESLRKESLEKQEIAASDFFNVYGSLFEGIKEKVISTGIEYVRLTKKISDLGIASFENRYSSPSGHFNELSSGLSRSRLQEHYITIAETVKIKNSYSNKIEDCKREWDGLIALCGANSAKDGLKILENLGFDITEIGVKKESTALITSIDANKLFIVKGDKA